jgi:transcriptional regulator with XRE-family HTH domain
LSQNAYGYYESGKFFPGPETLYYFSRKFNISMDWLILGKGPQEFEGNKNLAELEIENRELKSELETLKKQLTSLPPMSPEVMTLAHEMHESPTLFHEIMLYYHRCKEGKKE